MTRDDDPVRFKLLLMAEIGVLAFWVVAAFVLVRAVNDRTAIVNRIRNDFPALTAFESAEFERHHEEEMDSVLPVFAATALFGAAVGGFIVAPLFLVAAGSYWLPAFPWWWHAVLGIGIVISGIIGDLFESMLKRAADMKDSGTVIPGHGGVLDRIDALLFAAPVFYFFLRSV